MAIEILRSDVIDQIAAGEVLERPANLVKELVENALDAGATEIRVEFAKGGRQVVVRDNGCGMSRQDLELCLQRHATSKISRASDLYSLQSYGFRGEALASIAGVSEMTVVSRRPDAESGSRIQSHFGRVGDVATVSAKPGTEVEVQDLFANVPARLEFLKSDAAESAQIRNTLKAFALSRENIEFSANSGGDLLFHWPAGLTFKERAEQVLEHKNLFSTSFERDGIKVDVAVSSPLDTHAVNRNLWFFVQNRWVQDRSLVAAVMEAYRNLLMHGEYPTAVVRIQLPPDAVDVNVHPTKSAVKFRNSQSVFRAVSGAIRSVLEQAPWLKESNEHSEPLHQPRISANSQVPQETFTFQSPEFTRTQYSAKSFPLAEVREAVQSYEPSAPASGVEAFLWRDLQVIGQAHLTYILAQSPDCFYFVDQHAAHERVVFEKLMESFHAGNMDVQTLLLPLVIDLPDAELGALLNERANFERLGLGLDQMGPGTLVVQTIPSLIQESAVTEALKKAAHELSHRASSGVMERLIGDIFATMACHSVVRAGQALSVEQMKELLTQMDQFPLSSFCPHGRPVFIRRRFQDIEREFGRIV